MKLWDILEASQYMQIFSIYVTNVYGQNIPVARGTRSEMQEYDLDDGDLFYHLMDEIEYFHVTKKGVMVLFLRDKHYEERLESQYSENYVKIWDRLNPLTRPYLFGIETEEYTDEWICRFPCERDKAESEDKLDGDPIDIDKAVEHYEGALETLKGIDLEVAHE